jgi:hypothetical protein
LSHSLESLNLMHLPVLTSNPFGFVFVHILR